MSPRRPRLTWLILAALVSGCGGKAVQDGGHGGAPGDAPLDPDEEEALAIEDFAIQLTRAACERDVRCGTYLNVEHCEADGFPTGVSTLPVLDPAEAFYLRYSFGLELYLDLAHEYGLAGPPTLEACLVEMRNGPCNQADFRPEICQSALSPTAPRANGEACEAPSIYLPPRPCLGVCECGSCRQQEANAGEEGGPCRSGGLCLPGLECDSDDRMCRALPGLGEPCENDCAEGACREGTCERIAGPGEPCEAYWHCALDLDCVDGSCIGVQEDPSGSPCGWDSEISCHPGYCVYEHPEATMGTCGTPSLDLAGPCNGSGPNPSCPAGSYTFGRDPDTGRCECVPQLPPGEACDDSGSYPNPCRASRCFDGLCTEQPGVGEPCNLELGCEENLVCTSSEGVCLAVCVK